MPDTKTDFWSHSPLPYIVTIKEVVHQDDVPILHVAKVVAYSIQEACMQAIMMISGNGFENAAEKYIVTFIEPDVERFMQSMRSGGTMPPAP